MQLMETNDIVKEKKKLAHRKILILEMQRVLRDFQKEIKVSHKNGK